ncbi:UTP-glucose-1-phosphate uridylyltransferase [Yersinia enterocolitica]|nr:UTP-glucose-1-phosphate uridylyltransferase [Yersinia enterocolitica]
MYFLLISWPNRPKPCIGAWGRIHLNDTIAELSKKQSVGAVLMTSESYACGKKIGYMQEFVQYGSLNLRDGMKFRKGIKKLLSAQSVLFDFSFLNSV